MKNTIAIQGIKGSFHHQVANEYFGAYDNLDECLSFPAVVNSLLTQKSNVAIMAIENSIAGSIIPNHALIDANNLHVVGEHYLNINQNLMVLPGQTISDITEVHSHPMALLQCQDFFAQYPHIKLVEDVDTAETARRIYANQLKGIGAIASETAATLYGLEIIGHQIQTIKNNYTRFVIIKTTNDFDAKENLNKASLKFELEHKGGSLATVLNVMNDCNLNLTRIQSMPVIEKPWCYSFFVDFTFQDYEDYEKGKALLTIMAQELKVLGEYKNALV
ncbi:prephenate dehydratase [Flavobacterium agricola]|uniref:prephenate dehydratase n=1 Tax=Flavobacterium agricola TaxID=2870839 RepID=A0ABY6LWB0_9FLAO|nr:prephenate dehydratase [Flavobacterium agricola]UYW00620.1 prephenate dehydratase [Flavobacterium agricola]